MKRLAWSFLREVARLAERRRVLGPEVVIAGPVAARTSLRIAIERVPGCFAFFSPKVFLRDGGAIFEKTSLHAAAGGV
jgi:hypothetical protein